MAEQPLVFVRLQVRFLPVTFNFFHHFFTQNARNVPPIKVAVLSFCTAHGMSGFSPLESLSTRERVVSHMQERGSSLKNRSSDGENPTFSLAPRPTVQKRQNGAGRESNPLPSDDLFLSLTSCTVFYPPEPALRAGLQDTPIDISGRRSPAFFTYRDYPLNAVSPVGMLFDIA